MSLLEELYYGNIHPYNKQYNPKSDYAKFTKIIIDNEEKLTDFLNRLPNAEEERHLFLQMINAQNEIAQIAEFEEFAQGFRLGARLMLELFTRQNAAGDIC